MRRLQARSDECLTGSHFLREVWFKRGHASSGRSGGILSVSVHNSGSTSLVLGLDISLPTPFAALTVRSLFNERNEFLATTFPIADVNRAAPSPVVFPQIADGGGYVTQFVFLSTDRTSGIILSCYDDDGNLLAVGK